MVDLVITPGNMFPQPDSEQYLRVGKIADAAVFASAVWYDTETGLWRHSDADHATPAYRKVEGLIVSGAIAINQYAIIQTGGRLAFGAILTIGATYYLSKTVGRIAPTLAEVSGGNAGIIGVAETTSIMRLIFNNTGGVVA